MALHLHLSQSKLPISPSFFHSHHSRSYAHAYPTGFYQYIKKQFLELSHLTHIQTHFNFDDLCLIPLSGTASFDSDSTNEPLYENYLSSIGLAVDIDATNYLDITAT